MVRMQVDLTEEERSGLLALAEASGRTQSALIREAIDNLLAPYDGARRLAALDNAAGIWKDRNDLPDFAAARHSWGRN